MNLVVDCMQVISGRPLAFFRDRQREFLLKLIERCLSKPVVGPHRRRLRKIHSFVEARNDSLKLWRNSEAYYPVDYMTRSKDTEYFPYLLELLEVLVGMKGMNEAKPLPDGYYRLNGINGRVYEKRDGKLSEIGKEVVCRLSGFQPAVYLPRNGMFQDILMPKYYPDMKAPPKPSALKTQLTRTLEHMKDFSRDVWEDFQDAVSNVVLLTSAPGVGVGSMAITHKYFGGVFFNCFMNDEYNGVESLVHEYIHNRCTLWWESATPTGLPSDTVHIVSPMTGNRVMASTMIHALIIYISALQFYRFIQDRRKPADRSERARLARRASHLSKNMPQLYRRLRRTVTSGTDAEKLLGYLMEVYEREAR
ncbi:MAG TPA: hypothetical protein VFX30_13215 [bacterium]|nr:hypothetical protein [bacterium]